MAEINKEVADLYLHIYNKELAKLQGPGEITSTFERDAQKFAIKETALSYFDQHPEADKKNVWNSIYSAHISRKSGVAVTPEVIEKVISADQSWKKSSGHAFEEMVKELANKVVTDLGVTVYLQKDIHQLLVGNKLKNEKTDIEWLLPQLASDVFDLFAVHEDCIFACIQAKTSIRDRVTRDREPSIVAMNRFFWSIVFVLDGDFLKLPKFQAMVNGNTEGFASNGWHGLYAFSLPANSANGRIYQIDNSLEVIKKHTATALKDWKERRQWFGPTWEYHEN